MASPLEAQMILADHAVADPSGKVHMLGAGWSVTSSPTAPQAVVVLLRIPWDRTNQRIKIKLQLRDSDGHPVRLPALDGESEVGVESEVEVGRPAGLPAGSMVDASFALNVASMPLEPGRYDWVLEAAEQTFRATFTVMRPPGILSR